MYGFEKKLRILESKIEKKMNKEEILSFSIDEKEIREVNISKYAIDPTLLKFPTENFNPSKEYEINIPKSNYFKNLN